MAKWMVQAKRGDFQRYSEKFHIDPVIARVIRNRDIIEEQAMEEFLHPSLEHLYDPHLLKDGALATQLITKAIENKQHIRVIGDYDIDGIESTYILTTALQKLGANVDYAIPKRIEDGYGVNPQMITCAREDGVEFIITCDNGIAAHEAITLAKEYGMTVVITDHHEIPYEDKDGGHMELIPPADAVVNPKQADCSYPFPGICGAVVAWKLVMLLYQEWKRADEAMEFLENAAVATVGDVMELTGENRTIVKFGLEKLKHTSNLGMQALIERTGVDKDKINAYHIGFVIGPCLNATGRLDDACRAIELLQETEMEPAIAKAGELVSLNEQRKEMTLQGVEDAIDRISQEHMEQDKVLVLYLPTLHESLAGIVAGRIREQFERPAIVITDAVDGAKGSGRSIEAYSMYEELHKCERLFTRYGGHPMAAGISLPKENIPILREELNRNTTLTQADMEKRILIDVPMPLSYVTRELVEQLELLQPFGNGNPKPVFADKQVTVGDYRRIGKNQNMLRLNLIMDNQRGMTALYFGDANAFLKEVSVGSTISVTYYPQLNTFQNRTSLQVVIMDYC